MNIYDGKLRDIHQNIRIYIAGRYSIDGTCVLYPPYTGVYRGYIAHIHHRKVPSQGVRWWKAKSANSFLALHCSALVCITVHCTGMSHSALLWYASQCTALHWYASQCTAHVGLSLWLWVVRYWFSDV